MERRVNRATTSVFRFENGLTIGSLTHTILLHEMVSPSTLTPLSGAFWHRESFDAQERKQNCSKMG